MSCKLRCEICGAINSECGAEECCVCGADLYPVENIPEPKEQVLTTDGKMVVDNT